jgi:hypothetical protein
MKRGLRIQTIDPKEENSGAEVFFFVFKYMTGF